MYPVWQDGSSPWQIGQYPTLAWINLVVHIPMMGSPLTRLIQDVRIVVLGGSSSICL